MNGSTGRWAVASFVAGLAVLALASLPVVAICFGRGEELRHAAFVVVLILVTAALVVVATLDLLGERERRDEAMRMRGLEPPRGYPHTDLNRARLPIPPHPRGRPV